MEPPAKVTKFEMESQYLEGEVMEEGQEEWLSEGILTDDDYNPGSQEAQADQNDSNVVSSLDESLNTSAEDSQNQLEDSQNQTEDSQNQMDVSSQNISNIEETLNNLEKSETCNQTSDLPEELNAFLIRKVDGKVIIGSDPPKIESDIDESAKQSDDDDGNDTDDLLRVLGDGDQSAKHIKKENVMINSGDFSDGDDNFIFGGQSGDKLRNVKTYTAAKKALSQAPATKAEPEDDDVTDCSSDEAEVFKKMFTYKNKELTSVTPQISTTVKPGNLTISPLKTKPEPKQRIVKKVVHVTTMPNRSSVTEVKRPPSSPRRTYSNKRAGQASQTSQGLSQGTQRASQPSQGLSQGSQRAPQDSQRAPQGSQRASRTSQRASQASQGLSQGSQRASQPSQGLSQGSQRASQTPQGLSQGSQRASQTPQGLSQGSQRASQGSQRASQTSQGSQRASQGSQRASQGSQRALQTSQGLSQGSQTSQGLPQASQGAPLLKASSSVEKQQLNVKKQQSNVNKQQSINNSTTKKHQSESMNEEYLNDENMEVSSKKPKEIKSDQRLVYPEVMDEDVPTDGDSESDEESLYSELPSSESDCEDWFTLDIRSERAGDYIPLLGDKAFKLLSEERNRLKVRLDTLKKNLTALSDSGRELADQLKDATATDAELDAMLKAA